MLSAMVVFRATKGPAIDWRTYSAELETVTDESEWVGTVTVTSVFWQFWQNVSTDAQLASFLTGFSRATFELVRTRRPLVAQIDRQDRWRSFVCTQTVIVRSALATTERSRPPFT